jgi:hypothetical protein
MQCCGAAVKKIVLWFTRGVRSRVRSRGELRMKNEELGIKGDEVRVDISDFGFAI